MPNNVELNYKRLSGEGYTPDKVFKPKEYGWQGDWEGRALLAFCCHYEMHGKKPDCLKSFMENLKSHLNEKSYLGEIYDDGIVDEQQLSGHSWLIRGLVKYYELFKDEFAFNVAKNIVENLYLKNEKKFYEYPIDRKKDGGGVSGEILCEQSGWKLSSDVGCAFISVDGLAHYYALTGDERVKNLLDVMIKLFIKTDVVKQSFQTHATLSFLRGTLLLYQKTNADFYLEIVKKTFDTYLQYGMTLTYENFNWFNRKDTWTEPCAVVDSFILAVGLYKITSDKKYLTLTRRIWFNGLQFCLRDNGGAGPNSCVTTEQKTLKVNMYEAPFCCTMRYAEGLLTAEKNKNLLSWNKNADLTVDEYGRKFIDDKLVVKYNGTETPIFKSAELKNKDDIMSAKLLILP